METNDPENTIQIDAPRENIFDALETPAADEDTTLEHPLPVKRQLGVALGILALVFGATYVGALTTLIQPTTSAQDVTVERQVSSAQTASELKNTFEDVVITGQAAFVWDVSAQKVLFNKNADEQLPIASLTKLMTALVAYELLESSDTVTITPEAIREYGDSGFSDGEMFELQKLTDITLVESSNDGASALSRAAGASVGAGGDSNETFVRAMNIRAEELGLTQTHFNNVTGLDVSTSLAGAYASARDVVFLLEYILMKYPDVVALTQVDTTRIENEDGEYHLVKNTNDIVNEIPSLIASKTGYTPLAGGNLIVAFNAGLNRPIIVAVLGSTQSGRFDDVLTLVERAEQHVVQEGSE